ncbi:YhgE/Pip domain-containing protein [Deinococcus sp. Arct2-2]|uniref:YhgE/Pip domain-containing protein n=1 Tax=Deinococcus sp. Arct2-2 TaxID=2568653 RepID=UPI0010A4E9B9|nr:YhgE/Pip domain-containing protein [Deinococcus sp. Arct2-2]THF69951.1 YhgE/Pip domain-containing protein [Deinococcus sp. Arct2-2]
MTEPFAPEPPIPMPARSRGFLADFRALTPTERGLWRMPLMWAAALAILVIPVVYVALYLGSVWDPYGNLPQLPVALVNTDTGATTRGEQVNLGRDLVIKLREDPPVKFVSFPNEAAAQAAVRRGEVYFALTIPANFSAQAVTGDSRSHGLLHLYSAPGLSYFASRVGANLTERLTTDLNSELGSRRWEVVQASLSDVQQGFRDLKAATGKLRDGASTLAEGTAKLNTGAADLSAGAGKLADGSTKLAAGATDLSGGVGTLTGGVGKLSGGLKQLEAAAPGEAQLAPLQTGAKALASSVTELSSGLNTLQDGANQVAAGASRLQAGSKQANAGAGQLAAQLPGLASGLTTLQGGAGKVAGGAGQLAAGAAGTPLASGAAGLQTGVAQLGTGLTQAQAGAQKAATGAAALAKGTAAVAQGAGSLSVGAGQVSAGLTKAAGGAGQLATGASKLQGGVDTVVAGNLKLKAVLGTATASLPKQADLDTLKSGASTLAARSDDLATGAATLVTGAQKLASGAARVQDGSEQLRDGLTTLYAKIPDQTEQLGGDPAGLSQSVQTVTREFAPVGSNGAAFAPYFMALALWVGCTLTTFIFPYLLIPESARTSSQAARVLRKLAVPAVLVLGQAALVLLGVDLLGVKFQNPGLVILTTLAASLTFVVLILALNLLLGAAGRLLALVLLVLQLAASGGSYPVELSPGVFQAIHSFIPVTDVINALRYAMFGAYEGQYATFMLRMGLIAVVSLMVALLSRRRWQYAPDRLFRSPLITDVG